VTSVGDPLALGPITLRNRLLATAHASGLVRDGLPVADAWTISRRGCRNARL
jgi:hypothetical protein